jgi:hypothetical protein
MAIFEIQNYTNLTTKLLFIFKNILKSFFIYFVANSLILAPKQNKKKLDNGILVTLISPPRAGPCQNSIDEKKGKQHTLTRPKLS